MKFLWHFLGLISQCFVSVHPATPDVSSVCGPDTNQTLVDRIRSSQWQASDWLLDQQRVDNDWSWDYRSTASAILSLQVANETWTGEDLDSMEAQLTVKQLQIEFLREISHDHHFKEMSIGYMGYFVMALHATCQDISDFHGHNLVHHLHRRVNEFRSNETQNYFPYSLALLALCSSGSDVPHSAISILEEIQGDDGCFPLGVDVTSMAVMAMSCMQGSFNSASRLGSLRSMIRSGADCITDHQRSDGGFGNTDRTNFISTGLAVQALIAANKSPSLWRCEEALGVVLDAQHEDGHFGTQAGTIQILPLLSNRHHGSLVDVERECPEKDLVESTLPLIRAGNQTISVNFEITQEEAVQLVIFNPFTVDALPGESLYTAMERARQIGLLDFASKLTQWGNFIFSINDVENNNADGIYWFIYEVDENGNQVSAQTGPDGIYPVDGASYRWIYRAYVPH